jgi:hypothetical protein
MPDYQTGDMWDAFDKVDHFIITTNAIVKVNGALVMGAGIARQARDKFPGIDQEIGGAVKRAGNRYGLLLGNKLGVFQVKYHFKDPADPELIKYSCSMLRDHALAYPERKYALNFPGIGNGKLQYHDVKTIIDVLPSNVQVWTFQ